MPFNAGTYYVNSTRKKRDAALAEARVAKAAQPPEGWRDSTSDLWERMRADRVRWAVQSARAAQRLHLMYRRWKKEGIRP